MPKLGGRAKKFFGAFPPNLTWWLRPWPRDAVSAGYCYSNVCLSVRLSHSRTVLKRLKGLVTSIGGGAVVRRCDRPPPPLVWLLIQIIRSHRYLTLNISETLQDRDNLQQQPSIQEWTADKYFWQATSKSYVADSTGCLIKVAVYQLFGNYISLYHRVS